MKIIFLYRAGPFSVETIGSQYLVIRKSNHARATILPIEIFQENSVNYVVFMEPGEEKAPYKLINQTNLNITFFQDVKKKFFGIFKNIFLG